MNERNPSDKPQAQPWHAADEKQEKPAQGKPKGHGPIGTHSLTGGNVEVGLPPSARPDAEQDEGAHEDLLSPGEPELIEEPRAGRADLLGRKG